MFKRFAVLALFLVPVVLASGCISLDPEALAKAHPIVQQFLEEHPNADLRVVHYSAEEAEDIIDAIREDCGKHTIQPKEFYLVNITDEDFNAVAWIDWEKQIIECAYKEGSPNKPIADCNPRHKSECYGDYIYWFDSCNNREVKKEYCPLGCDDGTCKTGRLCPVEKFFEVKPDCVCPSDYEMIVVYPRCADGITGAITGLPIAEAVKTDTGYVEIAEEYTTTTHDRCFDAKPMYKCVKRERCRSRAQTRCYAGHVYWFDSCGHVQEKKEYCRIGCENGFCKKSNSCESMGGYCANIACTEDARICDDGTAVVRVPPECNFAPCPTLANASSGGGAANSVTGMITADTPTSTNTITYPSCRDGYKRAEYSCPNKGICCIPEARCWDSDEGRDYYKKGVIETSDGQRLTDHCNDNKTLTEKYCFDNVVKWHEYECDLGCVDGACLRVKCAAEGELTSGAVAPEHAYTCCDGLESFNPYTEDWVGGGLLCYDPDKGEPVCDTEGTDDEGWFYPNGTLLKHMDCASTQVVNCTDSDGGENYYVKGHASLNGGSGLNDDCRRDYVNDVLTNTGVLLEAVCIENEKKYIEYECPNGCINGTCIDSCDDLIVDQHCWEGLINQTCYWDNEMDLCSSQKTPCEEGDSGIDYYSKSTTYGYENLDDVSRDPHTDYCGTVDHEAGKLKEYYCATDYEILYTLYTCDCVDGACIPVNETCTDTDGGLDYYTYGTLIMEGAQPYDQCYSEFGLTEMYCLESGGVGATTFNCPHGCLEGACINETA